MLRFAEKSNTRRGFTIVELVSVIAVIAILAAILIPTFVSIAKDAEQRALKMDLDTSYTNFAADCGFRDEPVQNMDQYIFVAAEAVDFSGASVKVNAAGYRWNGSDKSDVATVATGNIDTSASTAIYGPFNGYYLLGKGLALNWSGSGTAASPYLIHSYQELRAIAERVARGNNFSGKVFRLENDLSINYASWLPIGGYLSPTQPDSSLAFCGTFDGNGYCIALSYGRVSQEGYCLFGYTKNATIKNLQVSGHIDGVANMGGIVGEANNTTVQNCLSTMNIQGDHHVGGIVGKATGTTTIAGCMNQGSVSGFATGTLGYDNAVGGIVGEADASVNINDCCNKGAIHVYSGTVGGIAGIARGKINNCVNTGTISAMDCSQQRLPGDSEAAMNGLNILNSLAGGIIGWGDGTATINGCANEGQVSAAQHAAGGIAGADATILNCANLGNIEAAGGVGGIVGIISRSACTVNNVMNSGAITAKSASNGPVGGIIGHVGVPGTFNLTLAANSGTVTFGKGKNITYDAAGMLIGSVGGNVTLTDTYLGVEKAVYVGNNAVTGTVVGKSTGTTGTPTLQTVAATMASAINSRISAAYGSKGYLAWTTEEGQFSDRYVPVLTHAPTFTLHYNKVGKTLRLKLNTAFTGAANVYMPFLDQNTYIGDDEKTYSFLGWAVGMTDYASGAKVSMTADTTFGTAWSPKAQIITPRPFE